MIDDLDAAHDVVPSTISFERDHGGVEKAEPELLFSFAQPHWKVDPTWPQQRPVRMQTKQGHEPQEAIGKQSGPGWAWKTKEERSAVIQRCLRLDAEGNFDATLDDKRRVERNLSHDQMTLLMAVRARRRS